MVENYSLILL